MKKPRLATSFLQSSSTLKALKTNLHEQEKLLSLIQSLLPAPLDQHCRYVLSNGNSLLIFTDSSAWASRLRYFSSNLRLQLQEKGIHFGKINVRVLISGKQKAKIHQCARPLSSANATLLRSIADGIQDPELSAALLRLSRHANS